MYGDGAIVSQPEVATKPNNESLPESHAMKTPLFSIYVALLLLAIGHRLSAQITEIDQFKVTAYNQTNQSPPVTPDYPNAYYFAVLLYSDTNYDISLPMVFTPSATTDGEFIMNQNGPGSFGFGSPVYASKDDFDADYPNGLYDYFVDYPDMDNNTVGDDIHLQMQADDLYSTTIPAFSPGCWAALQHVDPAADFNLSWNSYTQMPGTDYAHTFIGTYDSQTFNSQYGGFNNFDCAPDVTSATIPAGSLEFGRTYIIQLYFSNRQTPSLSNENGTPLNRTTIGFDDQTHTTLVTIPPFLHISLAGECVTLTWPSLATHYKLQTTHDLSASTVWCDVTNSPTVIAAVNSLQLPAKHAKAFFKLTPF